MFLLNLAIYQVHWSFYLKLFLFVLQYLIFVFFLETVMAKFKNVTQNNSRKYLMDQLKYAPDRTDGGRGKLLTEIDSEVPEHNRESTAIEEEHFWIKTLTSSVFCIYLTCTCPKCDNVITWNNGTQAWII